MKVAYYSRPCFLDHVIPQLASLSRCPGIAVDFFLELSPEGWTSSLIEIPKINQSGIIDGKKILFEALPLFLKDGLESVSEIKFVVHSAARAFSPSSTLTGLKLSLLCRKKKYDVFHFDDMTGRSAIVPFFLGKIAKIVTIHDPEPHLGESGKRAAFIRAQAIRVVNSLLFHCEYSRKMFFSKYGAKWKSFVVPLGINHLSKAWENPKDSVEIINDHSVLFFGRISPYKGLDVLYEAAPMVAEHIPNVLFTIAGRPIPGYEVPHTPTLPNGGRIETVFEFIAHTELCRLFRRSAVVAIPYVEASQSGIIATAYAFRRPVVVSNAGGLPEAVDDGETGLIVPARNPKALAESLIRLLKDHKLRTKMSEYIRKKEKNELSWERLAARTVDMYRDLLNS